MKSYSGAYRFGFNGKERDDETYGDGNEYDYGFRIYNPRLGKFLSVDPLTKNYAMLTPYQFASNMPIWASDLDGLEAVIKNKNDNSITFVANAYVVTSGPGNVSASQLKQQTDQRLVQQLSESERTVNGNTFKFKLNYITTDEKGAPITYEKAQQMATNSSITYDDGNGNQVRVEGWQTGVVVVGASGTVNHRNPGSDDAQFIPAQINNDGNFNMIAINQEKTSDENAQTISAVHEMGHFLGRRGKRSESENHPGLFGNGVGITSKDNKNVQLTPDDLIPMYEGGKAFGKFEQIEKKEGKKE